MMRFTQMRRHDFDEFQIGMLSVLYEQCFDKNVWQGFMRDLLEKPNLRCWFAEEDGERVGFRLGYDVGAFAFRSWFLGVKVTHRRQAVGRRLVQRGNEELFMDGYRRVTLNATPEVMGLLSKLPYRVRQKNARECEYELR